MSSGDAFNAKLLEASKHFTSRSYADALRILQNAPRDDPKVQHNVAILEYLQNTTDYRSAIATLGEVPGLAASAINGTSAGIPSKASTATPSSATGLTLAYEGNEIAHYNRAAIMIHNGFVEEGISVLRELLEMGSAIMTSVLGRAACLFYVTAVRTAASRKNQTRAKSDEALYQQVMTQHSSEFKKEPVLSRMMIVATADQAGLHDVFKGSSGAEKAVCLNDLGVLAMEEGKPHIASVYFAIASKEVGGDNSLAQLQHSIAYNAGICAIARGENEAALSSLLSAAESMKGSPLLWLRLAQASVGILQELSGEACLEAYEKEQSEIAAKLAQGGSSSIIAPGFQLLQIPSSKHIYSATIAPSSQPSSQPIVALALGAIEAVLDILVPAGGGNTSPSSALAECAHQHYASGSTQNFRTIQHALAYLCFIETLRQNFSVVYKVGSDLLGVHKTHALLPDVHVTVVTLVTEALCHLNKPALALKVLQAASLPDFVALTAVGDKTEAARQKQRVEALFVNVAVVHIAAGSWKQAQTIITSLLSKVAASTAPAGAPAAVPPFSASKLASLLQIYLELAQGNKEKALELLGKCPPTPRT